jgi:hypothetical protein
VKNSSFAAAGLDPTAGKTNKEMTIIANNTNHVFLIIFPPFCIVFISSAFYAAFFQMFSHHFSLAVISCPIPLR